MRTATAAEKINTALAAAADDDLRERVLAALGEALQLADAKGTLALESFDPDDVPSLIDLARDVLIESLESRTHFEQSHLAQVTRVIVALHGLLVELDSRARSARLDALANVHHGLARLQGLGSSAELLAAGATEACRSCGFDRSLILSASTTELELAAAYRDEKLSSEPPAALALGTIYELASAPLESEVLRRRIGLLVETPADDNRVQGPLAEARGMIPFVAVPIVSRGEPIAILEADRAMSGRRIDRLDRDTLGAFADGLGYALERVALVERLNLLGEQVGHLVQIVTHAAQDLSGADVRLVGTGVPLSTLSLGPQPGPGAPALSKRETDVMEAMAHGATNSEIAAKLYISEDTVKTHVGRILKKLQASNRVEAVTKFLRSSG